MQNELFSILDTVESTNNYAIENIKQGFGTNGKAWFAKEQWGGKGQRGKSWVSEAGQNIILSVVVTPNALFYNFPFFFSAYVANICRHFLADLNIANTKVKWPNDLFVNDRKAGGILIENIYAANIWQWAIIGIGINVNQTDFDTNNRKITSIRNETNIIYEPLVLSKKLHQALLSSFDYVDKSNFKEGLNLLNQELYRKNEMVLLLKDNMEFLAKIISVNKYGQIEVEIEDKRLLFDVGEVSMVMS